MKSKIRNWMRDAVVNGDKKTMANIPNEIIKEIKKQLQLKKDKKKVKLND